MSHSHSNTHGAGAQRTEWKPQPPSVSAVQHTHDLPDDLVHISDLAAYACFRLVTLTRLIRDGKIDAWPSLGQVLVPAVPRHKSPVIPLPEPKSDGGAA